MPVSPEFWRKPASVCSELGQNSGSKASSTCKDHELSGFVLPSRLARSARGGHKLDCHACFPLLSSWKVVALARIPDLSWTFASRVSKWQSFNLGWWRWDVRCVLPRTETHTNVKANRIGANLGVQCQSCTIALKLAEPQLLQSLTSVPCLRYAFHFIDAIDPRLGCFDWGN